MANFAMQGIDFVNAQQLWVDPDIVEIKARSTGESRSLVVGSIDGKFWSAVI